MAINKKIIAAIIILGFLIVIVSIGYFGGWSENKSSINNNIKAVGAATPEETLSIAAKYIEEGKTAESLNMYYEGSHNKMENLFSELDEKQLRELAKELKSATLKKDGEMRKTFTMEVTREGMSNTVVEFYMIKLKNGNWVIQ